MSFLDFDPDGYKLCVKQFMRFLARTAGTFHRYKTDICCIDSQTRILGAGSNTNGDLENSTSILTTSGGSTVVAGPNATNSQSDLLGQSLASSSGSLLELPHSLPHNNLSHDNLPDRNPSQDELYRISSRSPSPQGSEDLLDGLELGKFLKAAVLGMELGERRAKLKALKKLSAHELEREDNILRNRQLMEDMGLLEDIFDNPSFTKSQTGKTKPHAGKPGVRHSSHRPTGDDDDFIDDDDLLSDNHSTSGNIAESIGVRVRRSSRLSSNIASNTANNDGVGSGNMARVSNADPACGSHDPSSLLSGEESAAPPRSSLPATDTVVNAAGGSAIVSSDVLNSSHSAGGSARIPDALFDKRPMSDSGKLALLLFTHFPKYVNVEKHLDAIENAWATPHRVTRTINKAVLCTRGTAFEILSHVDQAGWPHWLTKYFSYLTVTDFGRCWGVAIALWTELERAYGFASPVSGCAIIGIAR
jgi:hypothetical protein